MDKRMRKGSHTVSCLTCHIVWVRRYRNPDTNLTLSCLDDPRPGARRASLGSMSLLSYWLLKMWQLNPKQEEFKKRAVTMLKTIADYSWDPECKVYRGSFKPDGTIENRKPEKVYITGYSTGSILRFGRIVAYFVNVLHDPDFKLMALRCDKMLKKATLPNDFVVNSLAVTLNYTLDMYDLTEDSTFLEKAPKFADTGIQKLYSSGLFVREPDDHFYEAKLGTGSFVQGLLRLYLDLHPQASVYPNFNWSF